MVFIPSQFSLYTGTIWSVSLSFVLIQENFHGSCFSYVIYLLNFPLRQKSITLLLGKFYLFIVILFTFAFINFHCLSLWLDQFPITVSSCFAFQWILVDLCFTCSQDYQGLGSFPLLLLVQAWIARVSSWLLVLCPISCIWELIIMLCHLCWWGMLSCNYDCF